VIKFYENAVTADQRNSALRCLGQTQDPTLINRTLDMILSGKVRDQDIYLPIAGLRSSKAGLEGVWAWLQNGWDEIYTKFPATSSMIGTIVASCTSGLTREDQLAAVTKFFLDKDRKGYDRSLSQSLDSINAKIQWVKRDDANVKAWLGV
jgi:aminopeptidase 2